MLEFLPHDTKIDLAFEGSDVSQSVAGLAWAPTEKSLRPVSREALRQLR